MRHCLSLDFVTMDIIHPEGIPQGMFKKSEGRCPNEFSKSNDNVEEIGPKIDIKK